ncbi:hypothetical protein Mspyr1_55900 (plasmid) [Mycolicibacterium gilvum Spyr1]|uniref:Uncharacterized protein n=1 Tax=Mycolicibacterium gilvum (strain DSM 45189 / LMG 24558 / Spyr1) TaxID=278137 RepID=E6TQ98_MYCSR|nr:hypothetical protein Mspyr1_55900 [Mycolicibacterium gilvum Spyr1]
MRLYVRTYQWVAEAASRGGLYPRVRHAQVEDRRFNAQLRRTGWSRWMGLDLGITGGLPFSSATGGSRRRLVSQQSWPRPMNSDDHPNCSKRFSG